MNTYKYSYGLYSIADYVGLVLMYFPGAFLLINYFRAPPIDGIIPTSTMNWIVFDVFLFIFLWTTIIISPFLNLRPEFMLVDEGIRVRLFNFCFFWKTIPWDKIKGFMPSPRYEKYLVLTVDYKLTNWHWMLGRMYGKGEYSEIIIMDTLRARDEFVSRVKQRINYSQDDKKSQRRWERSRSFRRSN